MFWNETTSPVTSGLVAANGTPAQSEKSPSMLMCLYVPATLTGCADAFICAMQTPAAASSRQTELVFIKWTNPRTPPATATGDAVSFLEFIGLRFSFKQPRPTISNPQPDSGKGPRKFTPAMF